MKKLFLALLMIFVLVTAANGGLIYQGTLKIVSVAIALMPEAPDGFQPRKIAAQSETLEERAFSEELSARKYEEQFLVPNWDRLLAASPIERFAVLAAIEFTELQLGRKVASDTDVLGIEQMRFERGGRKLSSAEWKELLDKFHRQGFEIRHTDWHQAEFEQRDGQPRSKFTFTIHAFRKKGRQRVRVQGSLRIHWAADGKSTTPEKLEVLQATIDVRSGPNAFYPVPEIRTRAKEPINRQDTGPINVYDLNGDMLPDILLANANTLLLNLGDWKFEARRLFLHFRKDDAFTVAVVADLNGDGVADFLGQHHQRGLLLMLGNAQTGFSAPPVEIPCGDKMLPGVTCLSAGDIDNDGDLDLFVGQWRELYEKMPKKFWDANDGFGNWLLINDGTGKFHDGTAAAGLGEKRFRRTYSASLVDLNYDQHLDLLVVSDFCGVDLYTNDGHGNFNDVTDQMLDEHHLFGMSHTMADYNVDGKLDLFVLGMGSTTARRLDRMGAGPKSTPETNRMRMVMGYGNRMYMGSGDGPFRQPPFSDQVCRTGWSWGSTSLDFDNDGYQDIFVANGNITGKSSKDYCTLYWCRDLYIMPEFEQDQIASYMKMVPGIESMSWDGHQVNQMLVNRGGTSFDELSYLLDVGDDFDARRAISCDFDLDGRPDLLVDRVGVTSGVTYRREPGKIFSREELPAVILYRNAWRPASERNWIEVALKESPRVSPQGARIEVQYGDEKQVGCIVSGDSYYSQHPAMKHFGLAEREKVDRIVVYWAGGTTTVLENPTINQCHRVAPPK